MGMKHVLISVVILTYVSAEEFCPEYNITHSDKDDVLAAMKSFVEKLSSENGDDIKAKWRSDGVLMAPGYLDITGLDNITSFINGEFDQAVSLTCNKLLGINDNFAVGFSRFKMNTHRFRTVMYLKKADNGKWLLWVLLYNKPARP